jgi:hypothetical protein
MRTVPASHLVSEQWREEQCPRCTTVVRGSPAAWAAHGVTVHGDTDTVVNNFPLRLVIDDRQPSSFETQQQEEDTCDDATLSSWPPW